MEVPISTYMTLINFTEQGVRKIQDTVSRFNDGEKLLQSMGGRVIGCWWVMGQYDEVIIFEAPDDETTARFIAPVVKLGNVRTTTMRCFSQEEAARVFGGLR